MNIKNENNYLKNKFTKLLQVFFKYSIIAEKNSFLFYMKIAK